VRPEHYYLQGTDTTKLQTTLFSLVAVLATNTVVACDRLTVP